MSSTSLGESMTRYDLRLAQDPRQVRAFTVNRWISWAGCAFGENAAAYFLLRYVLDGGPPTELLATGFVAVCGGAFGLTAWGRAPPATFLEVDGDGLKFEMGKAGNLEMRWSNPRFRLTLMETEGNPGWLSQGRPVRGILRRRKLSTLLPRDAFDEILSEARKQGLDIRSGPDPYSSGWTTYQVSRPARRTGSGPPP
jgi:hypothetical protein